MIFAKTELRQIARQLDKLALDEPASSVEDEKLRMLIRVIAATAYYAGGGKEAER